MQSSEGLSNKYIHVNNCGRQYLGDANHTTIRTSGRVDYQLLYILAGKCVAEVGGTTVTAREGDVILYRPGERQDYRFYKRDNSELLWIHFTGKGCEEYLKSLSLFSLASFTVGKPPQLLQALDSMMLSNEMRNAKDTYDDDVCDGCLYLALAEMAKIVRYGGDRIKKLGEISAIVDYMSKNFRRSVSIGECASLCHMSVSRFQHIFKETMGVSPLKYVLSLRVDCAKRLLENTALTCQQIADAAGFEDANYFSRVFIKKTGVSPSAFRKNLSAEIFPQDRDSIHVSFSSK